MCYQVSESYNIKTSGYIIISWSIKMFFKKENTRSFAWFQNKQKLHIANNGYFTWMLLSRIVGIRTAAMLSQIMPIPKEFWFFWGTHWDAWCRWSTLAFHCLMHCSRLHHTCSFSVWSCGSHFSIFSWVKMSSVTDDS